MCISNKPKSVLCISDLCCVGRCSLSVCAPVLSAMGIQPCMLPTALYTSHPACIKNAAVCKTGPYCESAVSQLKQNGVNFDCVYVGFIADASQYACAEQAFSLWDTSLKILDPVMGDGGRLYSVSDEKLCDAVKKLCAYADIITPNLTESAVLLGLPPCGGEITEQQLKQRVYELCRLCKSPVITGVPLEGGRHVTAGIDGADGSYFTVECRYTDTYFPGTGDLFTSVLTAAVLEGKKLGNAVEAAVKFVELAISKTGVAPYETKYGLWLENILKNNKLEF